MKKILLKATFFCFLIATLLFSSTENMAAFLVKKSLPAAVLSDASMAGEQGLHQTKITRQRISIFTRIHAVFESNKLLSKMPRYRYYGDKNTSTVFGIVSFICGMIGMIIAFYIIATFIVSLAFLAMSPLSYIYTLGLLYIFGLASSVASLVCGIMGIVKKPYKGLAIAGLILGCLALLGLLLFL